MCNTILNYKGYRSNPEYSIEDGIVHGRIEGITDLVSFESESANPDVINHAFQRSVDAYLDFCASVGKSPENAGCVVDTNNTLITANGFKDVNFL